MECERVRLQENWRSGQRTNGKGERRVSVYQRIDDEQVLTIPVPERLFLFINAHLPEYLQKTLPRPGHDGRDRELVSYLT